MADGDKRRWRIIAAGGLVAFGLGTWTLPALAVLPDEMLADPALEARARGLSQDLRCLVCQNQTIDDSNAPLARDLRLLVRERIKAGDSDDGVLAYITARYGDFVLFKPPFQLNTLLLWLGPLVVFAAASFAAGRLLGRHRAGKAGAVVEKLSAEERERLRQILKG